MPRYKIQIPVLVTGEDHAKSGKPVTIKMQFSVEAANGLKSVQLVRRSIAQGIKKPDQGLTYDEVLRALAVLQPAFPAELAEKLGAKGTASVRTLLQQATKRRHARRHEVRGTHPRYSLSAIGEKYVGK